MQQRSGNNAVFVEWYDVGGSQAFEASRKTWYTSFDAVIGVYDVTNANSRNNLDLWLRESVDLTFLEAIPWAIQQGGGHRFLDLRLHPKRSLSGRMIPVLLLGNKLDLLLASHKALREEFREDLVVSSHDDALISNVEAVRTLNSFLDAALLSSKSNIGAGAESHQKTKIGLGGPDSPFDLTPKARSPRTRSKISEVRLRIDFDEDEGTRVLSSKKDK